LKVILVTKIVLMNALYDQFFSFIGELKQMYPDDPDFPMYETSLRMLKTTNPSLLPKYIVEYTQDFQSQIESQDEKFFLDYEFNEYGEHVDLNIFSKLKKYYADMSTESKANTWKYIQNVYKLSKASVDLSS
jgi:hypothetical protein